MQKLQAGNVLGCDIRNNNGQVDFSGFKASGIQFVYVKATEGVDFLDPFFEQNVQKVKAAGLPVGAYHFATPGTAPNDAVAQAQFFLNAIQGKDLELCPVLDLEHHANEVAMSASQLVEWVQAFRSTVEAAVKMKVCLYTAKGYADANQGFNQALCDMPLWNASYWETPPANVTLPDFGGWTDWVMWQFTDSGTLPGVNGAVDLNYARSIAAIRVSLEDQYNVFQKQNDKEVFLRSFVNYDDAVAYAKQWAMGSVVRISDNQWMWDNFPKQQA